MGFSNYESQAPRVGKTMPFSLRGLRNPDGSHPVLHVEYLGEENRPFWIETLARSSAKARATLKSSQTPVEIDRETRQERDENRQTVIDHSARRIENAFHVDGTPATEKDIAAFVRAIPDVDFMPLWNFVNNYNNYREYPIAQDPVVLAEK